MRGFRLERGGPPSPIHNRSAREARRPHRTMASVTATNVLCRAPVAGKRAARAAPAAARVTAPARTTSSVSLKGSKGAFEGVAMRADRRGSALRAITDTKEAAADVEEEKPEPALESDVRPPLELSNPSSRPPVSPSFRRWRTPISFVSREFRVSSVRRSIAVPAAARGGRHPRPRRAREPGDARARARARSPRSERHRAPRRPSPRTSLTVAKYPIYSATWLPCSSGRCRCRARARVLFGTPSSREKRNRKSSHHGLFPRLVHVILHSWAWTTPSFATC